MKFGLHLFLGLFLFNSVGTISPTLLGKNALTFDEQDRLISRITKSDDHGQLNEIADTVSGDLTTLDYNVFGSLRQVSTPDEREDLNRTEGLASTSKHARFRYWQASDER